MSFTLKHIHRTINNLSRLMPTKPNKDATREYSLKETIFLMAPQLLEKREMGCTTNELVKALMDDQVEIKAPTLNRYLCEYQKTHGMEPEPKLEKAEKKSASKEPKPVTEPDTAEAAEKPEPHFGQSAKHVQDDSAPI